MKKRFKPEQFMPRIRSPAKQQTPEQIYQAFSMIFAAMKRKAGDNRKHDHSIDSE
jgi:hypothetical protein